MELFDDVNEWPTDLKLVVLLMLKVMEVFQDSTWAPAQKLCRFHRGWRRPRGIRAPISVWAPEPESPLHACGAFPRIFAMNNHSRFRLLSVSRPPPAPSGTIQCTRILTDAKRAQIHAFTLLNSFLLACSHFDLRYSWVWHLLSTIAWISWWTASTSVKRFYLPAMVFSVKLNKSRCHERSLKASTVTVALKHAPCGTFNFT